MVIKPDNFIEVVDNPLDVANNIVPFQRLEKPANKVVSFEEVKDKNAQVA